MDMKSVGEKQSLKLIYIHYSLWEMHFPESNDSFELDKKKKNNKNKTKKHHITNHIK